MKHPFIPDILFNRVTDVTPAYLRECGIKAVVLDIDNTLVTYGMAEPTAEVIAYVTSLREAGISVAIASNNKEERVALFNRSLGVYALSRSGKPSPRAIHAAARKFGVSEGEIAVIGDQIFTDVWAARLAHSHAVLVEPLPYRENLFFKFKRLMEKPFLRAYHKKNANPKRRSV